MLGVVSLSNFHPIMWWGKSVQSQPVTVVPECIHWTIVHEHVNILVKQELNVLYCWGILCDVSSVVKATWQVTAGCNLQPSANFYCARVPPLQQVWSRVLGMNPEESYFCPGEDGSPVCLPTTVRNRSGKRYYCLMNVWTRSLWCLVWATRSLSSSFNLVPDFRQKPD